MTDTASNNSMKLGRVISTFPTGATSQGNPIPLDCANAWARKSNNNGTISSLEIIENPTKEDYNYVDSYLDSVNRGINMLLSHSENLIAEANGSDPSPTHDSLRDELTRISHMKNVICLHK
tara:strand:- start:253 stop:615 length:363 start_codon:yes stop_codon:yes gene_type:complete